MFIYFLLGLIQGITEPIPISSSGHIAIFSYIFNINIINDLNFSIFVNFGSFIAIIYFYRLEIKNIINDFFNYIKTKNIEYKNNYKYAWLIVIGTIPAGIMGLIFKESIEKLINIKLIGLSLLITSIMLYIVKDIKGIKNKNNLTIKDALIVGLFQVIALFPGISRSGSTLVGGMIRNMDRTTSFNYSFMLYIPISIATMILGISDFIKDNISITLLLIYLISMIISMITTYYSLKIFKRIVEKGKLIYFVIYCILLGIITIFMI